MKYLTNLKMMLKFKRVLSKRYIFVKPSRKSTVLLNIQIIVFRKKYPKIIETDDLLDISNFY